MDIQKLSFRFLTHEINLACLKLTDGDFIAKTYQVVVDNILNHLFNVTFTRTTCQGITQAVVLEIELIVAFKQLLAVNVVAVHLMNQVSVAEELRVVDDDRRGDTIALLLHVLGNAVGRDDLTCIVGQETHEVFKERHVADLIPHNDILEQDGVIDILLILTRILLVESHLH